MKKVIYILGIIISTMLIILSIYTLIKINFVFTLKDGKMYDGFGTLYNNDKPNSPYTLVAYVELVSGVSLLGYSIKNINTNKGV